ncbi:MAG TPA: PEGA domain-containing protein [Longimicrobiaceae bacterium]|nr:PEGA domain-containing protein [Longimicrobiaceae bacterium]
MLRKAVTMFSGALAVCAVSGCATLFAGGSETITVNSEPSGAQVTTQTGQTLGTTPFTTTLDPSRSYTLTFTRQGYAPATVNLGRKVDGIAFLNLLCLLCWGIDFATGAVWGLEDDTINVTLSRGGGGLAANFVEYKQLACSNYAALDHAVSTRTLSDGLRRDADALVEQATRIPRAACDPAEGADTR